jgi:hypothetical protein
LVATQLSVLTTLGALPGLPHCLRLDGEPTPVHDVNGELLFWRLALHGKGYVDIAAHPGLGAPLVAIAPEAEWDPRGLAADAARRGIEHDALQFVAFSFPKLALRFLRDGAEVALLELHTWAQVPEPRRELGDPPGHFERWSFLDEQAEDVRRDHEERYHQRVESLAHLANVLHVHEPVVRLFDRRVVEEVLRPHVDARELRYSHHDADHSTCIALRGQETNVWSVAASVQMLLDFYRYRYDQDRLAYELGLGTEDEPTGLPHSREFDVVLALESLTGKSLTASMSMLPSFGEYRAEIRANRPLISFVPGHSRVVAGYTRTSSLRLMGASFAGLLVYDPWPPNAGVITRWENVDTTAYRRTFTARVNLLD